MVLFIVSIHLVMAAVILLLWRAGGMHLAPSMLPILILLPLWGPAVVIAYELHVRGGERSDEEAGMERFGITDEVYRSIRMEDFGASGIRPMEDVLQSGTPAQRRSLLLSVLHQGAAPFVRALRIAGVNDDTEVVHYAVTALVELRSGFNQRLTRMEKELREHPDDADVLRRYAALDEEYIASGIPERDERRERLSHCRSLLEKLLLHPDVKKAAPICNARRGGSGKSSPAGKLCVHAGRLSEEADLYRRLAGISLLQEDGARAEEAALGFRDRCPDLEDGYILLLKARALARDGAGIRGVIDEIREKKIYLSPAAREQIEFWGA